MSDRAADFTGSIPAFYDHGLGPVFFANFAGLQGGVSPLQTPQKDVRLEVVGTSHIHGYFLPFLGEVSKVNGVAGNGRVTFNLPPIEKGAVFWWTADSGETKE